MSEWKTEFQLQLADRLGRGTIYLGKSVSGALIPTPGPEVNTSFSAKGGALTVHVQSVIISVDEQTVHVRGRTLVYDDHAEMAEEAEELRRFGWS